MDKQQTIEGNEAIAKFMGATWYENITAKGKFHPEKLKYHEDWNWLMPAYKKVSALKRTNEPIWDIIAAKLAVAVLNADIEKVWLNCTTLIKLKETQNT